MRGEMNILKVFGILFCLCIFATVEFIACGKGDDSKNYNPLILTNVDIGKDTTVTRASIYMKESGGSPVVRSLGEGDVVEIVYVEGKPMLMWGQGAEHQFFGNVPLNFGNFRYDIVFKSDSTFPLTFKAVPGIGYVYLSGRGIVELPTGEQFRLGYEETVDVWINRLKDKRQHVKEGASEALGYLPRTDEDISSSLAVLLIALNDEAKEVRRNAAESIGRLFESNTQLSQIMDKEETINALDVRLRQETDKVVKMKIEYAIQKINETSQVEKTPSSELLDKIKKSITSPKVEIFRNQQYIPVVVFAIGAKAEIGGENPMMLGSVTIISDPSDPLKFRGAEKNTLYEGGTGAVIVDGQNVYLYHLTLPENFFDE